MPRLKATASCSTMTANVRACQSCRSAKTKCNLIRPICGRCARLGHRCFGYTAESDFVFRNENAVAQRNSERARKKSSTASFDLTLRASSAASSSRASSSQQYVDITTGLAAAEIPWLQDEAYKTIPSAVIQPMPERAMDKYFYDWITKPADKGHIALTGLPQLYMSSPPNSTFRIVMEAAAYAHQQGQKSNGIPLHYAARATYGRALARMHEEVMDPKIMYDIRLLAALIALDNFEILHLGRYEFLGPHSEGAKLLLSRMGPGHFNTTLCRMLWKTAHVRLLSKHILARETPAPVQLRWTMFVNTSEPDLHIHVVCVELAVLIGNMHALIHSQADFSAEQKLERSQALLTKLETLLTTTDEWLSNVPRTWREQHLNGHVYPLPPAWVPMSRYGPQPVHELLIQINDFSIALNYYQTIRIVVHDTKIELFKYIDSLSGHNTPAETADLVAHEIKQLVQLSNDIISGYPLLVEAAERAGPGAPERSKVRLDMTGRFAASFSMMVFMQVAHVPAEHKKVARWVRDSLQVDYALF